MNENKHKFKLASFVTPCLLFVFMSSNGCGTNAGNPFTEPDDGDNRSVGGVDAGPVPAPEPQPGSGNAPVPGAEAEPIAQTAGKPIIVARQDAVNSGLPEVSHGSGVGQVVSQVPGKTENSPSEVLDSSNASVAVIPEYLGSGSSGTAMASVEKDSSSEGMHSLKIELPKDLKSLVREIAASARQCEQVSLTTHALKSSNSSGNLSNTSPSISVTLGSGFAAGAIPVIISGTDAVLSNGSRLTTSRDYSVGVYEGTKLVCVYKSSYELVLSGQVQISLTIKFENQ